MVGVRLPENLDERLKSLAAKTHRPISYYLKEALEAYLNEYEEDLKAVADYEEQVKKGTLEAIPLKDLLKKYNLNEKDLDSEVL
jgi:RHH-type rel operon transcriptional repressor/antitoxin RelB